jgi:aromatic-amino-acid transaminase
MKPKNNYNIDTESDTLFIAKKAKDHQLKDDKIVNATVGSIYHDDHTFYHYESVKSAIQTLDHTYPYTLSTGNDLERLVFESWILRHNYAFKHDSVLSIGGTGALHIGFDSYLNAGDLVISGIPMWSNNYTMLEHLKIELWTFPLFNGNHFNFEALKNKVELAKGKFKRIMILMNDPAHNPSGYQMTKEEWTTLLRYTNEVLNTQDILIMNDMAYLDFSESGRDIFKVLETELKSLLFLAAFSGSKSFSLYGARTGMLMAISNDKEEIETFKEAAIYVARATYSLPSSFGFKVIHDVLTIPKYKEMYLTELNDIKSLLTQRAVLLKQTLDNKNIPYFPYHGGFFLTIQHEHPIQLLADFQSNGIYGIPVEHGLRLAISSLTLKDIERLEALL